MPLIFSLVMKFLGLLTFFFGGCFWLFSQQEKPLTTAFPFLLLGTDAAASGRGNLGVVATPDVFSQRWNSAKYTFTEQKMGIGMSYVPYLHQRVRDIFLGNMSYYRKTTRGAWAGSFTYFSIGEVKLIDDFQGSAYVLGGFRPIEFALDASYNLKLSERFSLGVLARYLRSDLRLPTEEKYVGAGFSCDISGYYTSKEHLLGAYFGSVVLGFQLSNLGMKIKYDDLGRDFFLPTNLKLGAGYVLTFDSVNKVSFLLEVNKLLVSTSGDVDVIQGVFKSFSDALGGFSEELQEVFGSVGLEYAYDTGFFLRTGYFYQHENKGGRKHLSFGTGFRLNHWQFDFSYLFSTGKTAGFLSKSANVSLQYSF